MPPGRKRLLTDELRARIMGYIRAGAYPERAAVAAGISERSHYLWQAKGLEEREHIESGKKPRTTYADYLDYVDAIDQAVAEAEMVLIGKVSKADQNWGAHLALLERRFRDRWSPKAPAATGTPAPTPTTGQATGLDQVTQRRRAREQKTARA